LCRRLASEKFVDDGVDMIYMMISNKLIMNTSAACSIQICNLGSVEKRRVDKRKVFHAKYTRMKHMEDMFNTPTGPTE